MGALLEALHRLSILNKQIPAHPQEKHQEVALGIL
jgi:hypothetical protein